MGTKAYIMNHLKVAQNSNIEAMLYETFEICNKTTGIKAYSMDHLKV